MTNPAAVSAVQGPAPEVGISRDLVRRGLITAPIVIALGGVLWGLEGAYSAGYAIALVLLNFALAAGMVARAARSGFGLMVGAVLFGYLVRLALILVAVLVVRDASWISLPALGASIIVTHLGLLVWELKYVALSLAHPGLKPRRVVPTV